MKKLNTIILTLLTCILFAQNQNSYYLVADRVFDGESIHENWAVVVQGDKIIAIGPKIRILNYLKQTHLAKAAGEN